MSSRRCWKVYAILLVYIFLAKVDTSAQHQWYEQKHTQRLWNNQNGLPQNTVFDIAKDGEGFVWIATEEGLARFDGTEMKVFDDQNIAGLSSNTFYDLEPSFKKNAVWAASESSVLLVNKRVKHTYDLSAKVGGARINNISEGANGRLWIGTSTGQLFYIQDHLVKEVDVWKTDDKKSIQVLQALGNDLLIGTDKGLYKLLHTGSKAELVAGTEKEYVRALAIDKDGSIWIGTKDNGLFNLGHNQRLHVTEKDGLKESFITCLAISPAGDLWIGTSSSGVQVLQAKANFKDEDLYTADGVRSIFFGANSLTWLGTSASGLVQLKPAEVQMLSPKFKLSSNLVVPVFQHDNGDIWVGTAGEGISIINRAGTRYINKKNGLSHNLILTIYGNKDFTYIGTPKGLDRYNNKTGRVDKHFAQQDGLVSNIVQMVFIGSDNRTWIGTRNGGLHLLSNNKIIKIKLPEAFLLTDITSAYEDSKHNMWIGSRGSGMIKIEPNGRMLSFLPKTILGCELIDDFCESSNGRMLMATEKGLLVYNGSKFLLVNSSKGLRYNSIFRIIDDGKGSIWLSGNHGLQRMKLHDLEMLEKQQVNQVPVRLFNSQDGMLNGEVNGGIFPAGYKLHDGTIWFPTVDGVAIVDPARVAEPAVDLETDILRISYGDKVDATLKDVRIPPGVYNIQVKYTSIDFLNPNSIQYHYRLVGMDDKWIAAGNRREAFFSKLDPGTYTFEVKAEQFNHFSKPASFTFQVQPFFYQTAWFRVLMVLLLFAAGFLFKQIQTNRREGGRLKALVDEQTYELKKSNERFKYAAQASSDAIWEWDLQQNSISWGDGFMRLFGYPFTSSNDPLFSMQKSIHPQDVERVLKGIKDQLEGTETLWQDEFRYLKADGSYAFVEDKGFIVRNEDGKPVRMIGAMQDITTRKQTELEREMIIQELTQSNNDLKQFSFIASHNLRAPLSNITGLLRLLDHSQLGEDNVPLLQMIEASTQGLQQTIDDVTRILVIKNNPDTHLSWIPVQEVLDKVTSTFISPLSDISAVIHKDLQVDHLYYNRSYLESIFLNLISNAIKFRSGARSLVINISTYCSDDGKVVLTFSDNGIGLNVEQYKDRLFGFHQRFHEEKEGKGLGLFIIKSQVNALGGKVEVQSEVAKGTTFIITFHHNCTQEPLVENVNVERGLPVEIETA
ncbi:two-component regulator propeller domain-containing protein [Aridibaculum aurantiacum]|uniref:two-component regulator propeller domain-containing protein n=1 Tax=Aridibaculum aurantiacum TaxID=2810307 RepID=UPI001A9654F4|nr:two-component regulator propeller domain-containing protein [Aridibaculum aurantiacum]